MSPIPFLEWLGSSALANAMNGPEWAFPVVESLHFIGFAFLIGTIAIVDLRLLGGSPAMDAHRSGLDADYGTGDVCGRCREVLFQPVISIQDDVPGAGNPVSFRRPAQGGESQNAVHRGRARGLRFARAMDRSDRRRADDRVRLTFRETHVTSFDL
jgi:hypothetical protein